MVRISTDYVIVEVVQFTDNIYLFIMILHLRRCRFYTTNVAKLCFARKSMEQESLTFQI